VDDADADRANPDVDQRNTTLPEDLGPIVVHCVLVRTAANTPLGMGANADTITDPDQQQCDFNNGTIPDLTAIDSGVVEVMTTPLAPSVSFHVRIDYDDCEPDDVIGLACKYAGDAEGTDEVRVDLAKEFFKEHGRAHPRAYVWSDGLSVDQEFHVYISMFLVGDLPAGYSALP
jgi:hypothetical protein